MSGGTIGSVAVEVVPSAERFWRRFEAQTSGQAREVGRRAGEELQRGLSSTNPTVRVRADTTQARAQMAALNKETDRSGGMFEKLIKAAITLSPAIAPVAAAAGAAVAEFGALGVTGILALKGLKAELQGTGSEAQVTSALVVTLKESLNELSKTAAANALPGLAEATTKLRSDLPALNDEIGRQGRLLGDVASHLTGGLVGGFSTFGPVLDEVSGSVDRIAAKFEAWATGPGGAHLAKVLGDDYARVAPIIDDVAGAVVHLVSAAHASGLGILSELQLLARVVDDFPTPVLEGIIATFVSARTISAAVGAFNSVSGALQTLDSKTTKFALRQAAAAASTEASNAQVAASAAAEAAAVAESQAAVAAAYAASQREIAVATLGTETELTGLAAVSVQAAEEQAAAAALAAEAAVASAAEIGAAAETAAAESAAASEAAAFSWSAMLGPAGIVVGAVALLGLTFLGQGRDTQQATQDIRQYTDALVASNGVVTDGIRADIAKQLSQQGLITAAAKYGLTVRDLTDYVLGQGSAQGKVNAVLDAGWRATDKNTSSWHSFTDAAFKLGPGLTALKGNIAAATGAALAENEAMAGVSDTVTHQAGLLHTTASAYLDAKDAASKSTQQSRKQTLQWQIENNAGQLLAQTLDKLAGKKLSFAQAENQFQSQLVTLAQTLEQGSSALTGLSSDAIQNRSNLLQLVQGAEQTAEAFGNMKGSALAGRKELIKLRQQIIDNAVAHGEDRKEVERYVDSVLKIPTRRGTEITLNDAKARAKARDLRNYLNSLHATVALGASYKRGDPGLPPRIGRRRTRRVVLGRRGWPRAGAQVRRRGAGLLEQPVAGDRRLDRHARARLRRRHQPGRHRDGQPERQQDPQAAHQKGARPEVHRCRSDLLVVPGGRERCLAAVQG
jgi:hypothetical protein